MVLSPTMELGKRIYLDYGASTPVAPEVFEAMTPYLTSEWGNPVSLHKEGVTAKNAMSSAREIIAREIGAHADEIIFTASGTEGNNTAIMGTFNRLLEDGVAPSAMHFITSAIEHPSVLDVFAYLEKRGVRVDYIGVDSDGLFDLVEFKKKVTTQTNLVSVMMVNNEIGTIQPIEEIGRIILALKKENGGVGSFPYFHTDASQAMLFNNIDVEKLHVDFLTTDAQKIYGPKGVGALFIRRGVVISPLIRGGKQERGMRAGTENVAGIVGMGKAFELMARDRDAESARLLELRNYFIDTLKREIPIVEINGTLESRLPNNVNVSIPGYESEFMALQLDAAGIACATRSACIQTGSGSYVVRALGRDEVETTSTLRFTTGKLTTKEEVDYTVSALKKCIHR
jgi:cysteine desulfurase